jgi:hypothetical protein
VYRLRPDQEERWQALCEAADAFVAQYWLDALDRASQRPRGVSFRRFLEEAASTLWRGHRTNHVSRSASIIAWWQAQVGDEWKAAMKLWQEEAEDY